ncbi:hypothetical protein ONE63_008733 [Megalurothrips usitatus]|uniref:CCHC-type domain-containing protein n=1 Tax=Megalurothrips usitatus TaxID=439358 RepID=A0AAV7XN59_9NEOP|nr:hypothetical protein ONE63_008733 [Megalurothrips usitatus]
MTRFARAKGSKSSNARETEEATGWSGFKRQGSEKKPEADATLADAQSALKRIKEKPSSEAGWADFGTSVGQNQSGKGSNKRHSLDKDTNSPKAKKVKKFNKTGGLSNAGSSESGDKKEEFYESGEATKDNATHKNGKRKGKKEFKRRKPFVEHSTINVNGLTINVSKFDGFDVKSDDAVRLKELKSKMLKEGIPRADVERAIKLERRRAEKALSREKKKVCFNCRQAGHLLSECPAVDSSSGFKNVDTIAVNMCYKCGSTEHTHFECKVKKNNQYSFATCFICKEQGHISSQCPDNPRGLYPQGGSCKVCGEVTHLKKDCPQLTKEKMDNTLTLDTFSSVSNVESLGEEMEAPKIQKPAAKRKKIVKF